MGRAWGLQTAGVMGKYHVQDSKYTQHDLQGRPGFQSGLVSNAYQRDIQSLINVSLYFPRKSKSHEPVSNKVWRSSGWATKEYPVTGLQ